MTNSISRFRMTFWGGNDAVTDDHKPPQVYVDCPKHGRQLAFSVPGLTGPEPVCVQCI